MNTPIDVFSEWAQNGKDEGMERHHYQSVMNMINFASSKLSKYSFIDADLFQKIIKSKNMYLIRSKQPRLLKENHFEDLVANVNLLISMSNYSNTFWQLYF